MTVNTNHNMTFLVMLKRSISTFRFRVPLGVGPCVVTPFALFLRSGINTMTRIVFHQNRVISVERNLFERNRNA